MTAPSWLWHFDEMDVLVVMLVIYYEMRLRFKKKL